MFLSRFQVPCLTNHGLVFFFFWLYSILVRASGQVCAQSLLQMIEVKTNLVSNTCLYLGR